MSMTEEGRPITGVDELVARFAAAGKPRGAWRVGVEHEKIGVDERGGPLPYSGPRGIAALFERLAASGGWTRVSEGANVIALHRGSERVTLEPGGQLELSGAPLAHAAEIRAELEAHLAELKAASAPLGMSWVALGFRPFGRLDDIEWVPKGRYAVMREVLPARGKHAHDMMKRTATVQANLDYADEEDAERKLRAAMSVTTIVTALFANSPIVEGEDSGYASFRARAWLDTDPDRCGLLPFAFERGDVFRRYVEWALDVPLLFLYDGRYHESGGVTFRRFMREGIQGKRPTLDEWDLHLSTLFPEARVKNYLEVRGADAGPLSMVLALPALWRGLLYDEDACAAATALTARLGFADRLALREAVPAAGLAAVVPGLVGAAGGGVTVRDLAVELVGIARQGLERQGEDLAVIDPLVEIAATGRAPADRVRDVWREVAGDRARFVSALAL